MTLEKLTHQFFARSPDAVAKELLGKYATYVTRILNSGKKVRAHIAEIAAYKGTAGKRTSKGIKAAPGIISVNTKYGNHLLDIATGKEGEYSCITLRAAEFEIENQKLLIDGPGKLCRALQIDTTLNNLSINNNKLWIEAEAGNYKIKKLDEITSNNCLGIYRLGEITAKPAKDFPFEIIKKSDLTNFLINYAKS